VFAGAFTAAGLDVTLASAPYMAEFEPLQHRALVLFDWRGLGASGPADRFTSGGFVNDLAAVVDTIGDDPVDLLGESFGAHAAAVYAAKHPERVSRLALMPIRPAPHSPRTSLRFAEIAHIADADWPRFAELFSLIAFGWVDPELVRVQHARMMTQLDADRWRELNEAVEALDGIKVASQLVMPTLAQIAEPWAAETKTAVRRFVGALPDGRLTTELTPAVPTGSSAAARNRAAVDFFDEGRGAQRDDPGDRTGLQTVLFTDLTGSTAMQSRLGDGAAHAIVRAHDTAVRLALGGFHGREVTHTGDGIMAAFGSAAEAVSCEARHRDLQRHARGRGAAGALRAQCG
jgi:pimeloyl-ACP methyl ester carboxylesterase